MAIYFHLHHPLANLQKKCAVSYGLTHLLRSTKACMFQRIVMGINNSPSLSSWWAIGGTEFKKPSCVGSVADISVNFSSIHSPAWAQKARWGLPSKQSPLDVPCSAYKQPEKWRLSSSLHLLWRSGGFTLFGSTTTEYFHKSNQTQFNLLIITFLFLLRPITKIEGEESFHV